MIKFGNKRINVALLTQYSPHGTAGISFDFITSMSESVTFDTTEERDKMLEELDKFLVNWEDGKPSGGVFDLAELLFNSGQGEGEGPPPGATVQ